MRWFWKISSYDGDKLEFERLIPKGNISEAKMKVLLQHLSAMHLEPEEVILSSLRKNATGYLTLLEVRTGLGGLDTISTGHHYTATIQEAP